MILSARAESIILLAPPAESMILSAPPKGQWAMPAAQWGGGDAKQLRWATGRRWHNGWHNVIGASDEVIFCTSDFYLFFLSKLPHTPDFRNSSGFS
jgi:hypothetical protein